MGYRVELGPAKIGLTEFAVFGTKKLFHLKQGSVDPNQTEYSYLHSRPGRGFNTKYLFLNTKNADEEIVILGEGGNIYQSRADGNCHQCADSCRTCSGPLETQCLTCYEHGKLDISSGKCNECHETCLECSGYFEDNCLSCSPPMKFDASSNRCCDPSCETCGGPLAS
jgi:hypothetical protein